MKITFKQFEESVNDKKENQTLLRNTSLNREFHQGYIMGELYSGFRSEQDIIKMKTYGNHKNGNL